MTRSRPIVSARVLVPLLAVCAVACGGHTNPTSTSGRTASTSSSEPRTTSTEPDTSTSAAASTTSVPALGHVIVVPAVPAGGAAPATIPPSPPAGTPGSSPTTVKPYDPTQNIDLSGTPGVTLDQQHAAEQLIRDTLHDIAKYADQSVAYAAGYRTIGDGVTGDEHWVNWKYAYDNDILDAEHPESLVYSTRDAGHPVLEAAMYSLPPGSRFTDIPPLFRSPLTQFHVHNNLCFAQTSDPLQKVFAGFTDAEGNCAAGTTQEGNVPMIHVWIVKNPCGPFAALSGIAAGQVPPGETPNCDTAHAGVL